MANDIQIVLSYALQDAPLAKQLTEQLLQKNIEVISGLQKLKIEPGEDLSAMQVALLVIVSEAAATDKNLLADIQMAKENHWKIIPVQVKTSALPEIIRNILPFDFDILITGQLTHFLQAIGIYHLFNIQAPAPAASARPIILSAPSNAKKNLFKNIIDAVNPFKFIRGSKADDKEVFEHTSGAVPSDAKESAASRGGFDLNPQQPITYELSPAPESPAAPSPAVIAPGDNKGKVLYDIPDKMIVHKPQKCLVRLGRNEAIVRDDDTFSPSVKIDAVPIYKVMAVDLVDISEPPKFSIKCISTPDQIVDDDTYSEWIFMVTPLSSGTITLFVKVSVVKIIDGKERRKELLFEKPVDITASESATSNPLIQPLVGGGISSDPQPLKDLLKEKDMKEMDPPVVFISYAHSDKQYFDVFLQYLQSQSGWKIWTDRKLEIGADWYESIQQSIKDSDLAVLLISGNFISSAFIKENEFAKFSDLNMQKPGFNFVPVLLRDVDFTRWQQLAKMQLFVAYGDEYGVPEKRGQMISFAKLCRFDNNNQPIPNDNLDTYFKNLVKKAETEWLKSKTSN